MKKTLILFLSFSVAGLVTGCNTESIWQGVYYEYGIEENEEYGPVFDNYNACKKWALSQLVDSDDDAHCLKNCHDSVQGGTPVCEEVVRTWAPFPHSYTFDNYKE
ncbi:hypothetical protein HOC54_01655 [Candidatus Peregrinibacteria bacterium]|jgi:hypothetical protein|nr:hypothetical protein [Candidatus Peregrinibacteria bacterium]